MAAIAIKAFSYKPLVSDDGGDGGTGGASEVPEGYECGKCKKHGCKLWRDYQTFLDHQTLMCVDCSGESQKRDVTEVRADGCRRSVHTYGSEEIMEWSDQIGWRVPAVPTEDGSTFWGYTSVPQDGVAWWKRLPSRIGS